VHAADADRDHRTEVVRPAEGDEELAAEAGLVVDERLDEEPGDRCGPQPGPHRGDRRGHRGNRALDDGDPADVRLVGDAAGDDLHHTALTLEAGELLVGHRRHRFEDDVTRDRDPEGAEEGEAVRLGEGGRAGPTGPPEDHPGVREIQPRQGCSGDRHRRLVR
jgi:hypothetical protein